MLNERFDEVVTIIAASNTATTQSGAGTSNVSGSSVDVPSKPAPGTTYRFKAAGSKSGANAAHTVHLKLGATQVMTLTADDSTAVDWIAEFTIRFSSAKAQKIMGQMISNTTDGEADYAAATVDCTAGNALLLQITSGNAGDGVVCEMFTVEKWVK